MIYHYELLEKAGEIEGKNVYCIISLYENHHTIYANKDDSGITLFIENDKGQIIDTFLVSNDNLQEWNKVTKPW